ncbi:Hypothetical protein NTJ_15355 [Nesidiocoris tenuis]|uniref:Uncharacterized protein n=1 Tax=Nesidiocoris tenuis TaxID=355587 RepID=A0ABN7BDT4_9HEMI|nr:Hypothetical protein NTJ_15355 [Nesidiocoris tenuis]
MISACVLRVKNEKLPCPSGNQLTFHFLFSGPLKEKIVFQRGSILGPCGGGAGRRRENRAAEDPSGSLCANFGPSLFRCACRRTGAAPCLQVPHRDMPSMSTSHGGILYYVVQVPKEPNLADAAVRPSVAEPNLADRWTPGRRSFDEKCAAAVSSTPVSSTPLIQQPLSSPTHDDSTDSGWDNPFRPDGDLSREADELVELINSGKPITPTPLNGEPPKLPDSNGTENGKVPSPAKAATNAASPPNKAANGTKPLSNGDKSTVATPGGQLELQRSTVAPTDAATVEHVNLKKKPKCKCCVVQ